MTKPKQSYKKQKGADILNTTGNETKESPLIVIASNLSSKSSGKLNKIIMRLNAEFNKSRKKTNNGDIYV